MLEIENGNSLRKGGIQKKSEGINTAHENNMRRNSD